MTAMPDVPTTAEAGIKNYETSGWFALLAPRGTPKPIVTKLNQEIAAALADPAVRDRFVEQGGEAHRQHARGARQVHQLPKP